MDRRVISKNEQSGQLVHSSDYGNTSYTTKKSSVHRISVCFTNLYSILDYSAKTVVDSNEFNVILKN